jgi:hypothetical protein
MAFPNPFHTLQQAVRAVPAVKYALGVAGIVSVIAIIKVGWQIDALTGVLGTVVMFVLMTVLVVFAKLSAAAASEFRLQILFLIWSSLIITISTAILLFTSAFFMWPLAFESEEYSATRNDRRVWDLEEEVNGLRGTWDSIPEYGDSKRNEVLERATRIADKFNDIEDNTLGPSGHVIKREFSCYADIMAADTESHIARKQEFARRALDQCKSALSDLRIYSTAINPNKNIKYTAGWAKREDQVPFTSYLLAMAQCIDANTSNNQEEQRLVMITLREAVPTYYLNKYPPERDSVLKQCVVDGKEVFDVSKKIADSH